MGARRADRNPREHRPTGRRASGEENRTSGEENRANGAAGSRKVERGRKNDRPVWIIFPCDVFM